MGKRVLKSRVVPGPGPLCTPAFPGCWGQKRTTEMHKNRYPNSTVGEKHKKNPPPPNRCTIIGASNTSNYELVPRFFGYQSHKTEILSNKGPILGVRGALNPEPFVTNRKVKRKCSPFLFLFEGFGVKDPFLSFLENPDPFWLAVLGHFLKQYGFPNGPQTLNPSNKTKVNGSIKLQCLPKIMKNVNRLFSLLFSIFSYAYAYFDLITSGIFSRKTTSIPRP